MVECVLALGLALVVARGVQLLVTPPNVVKTALAPSRPTAGPQPDLSMLERFDPFHRTMGGGAETVANAAGGLSLFGTRVEAGGRGSAILGSETAQASYTVGEEVQPGVILAAVAADHVLLDQGGSRVRLEFGALGPPAAMPPPPPVAAPVLPPPPAPASPEVPAP